MQLKPHHFAAPGLTGNYARVINKTKKHQAVFRGNDIIMCSCKKYIDSEQAYRDHLGTKVSFDAQNRKSKRG